MAAAARVIGVTGGPANAAARKLGAHVVVDRREEDFVSVVKAETGGLGANVTRRRCAR